MKKQYIAPEMKVVNVNPSEIVCVSAGFGDGTTNSMNANERDDFGFDEDDNLW